MHNWRARLGDGVPLLVSDDGAWSSSFLQNRILAFRTALQARRFPQAPVALLADNSPEWIAIDLATQELDIPLIPLPLFFTTDQWQHAIAASGAQTLFCEDKEQARLLGFAEAIPCDSALLLYESALPRTQPCLNAVQKITFTSGTTAQPKGVCMCSAQQWHVADAIRDRLSALNIQRHLCLLPLPVLLENIAGVYTGLLCGASIACPPLSETGFIGASRFDAQACLDAIQRYAAHSIILLPQMLQALVAAASIDDERIRSLKFAAVGGARTSAALIRTARDKGFPVYEGYGLSECASVVSLNSPGHDRIGSAGIPLKNRKLRIAPDGEVEVHSSGDIHYLGDMPSPAHWMPTGDIGHLDADGFLHVRGRKKNVLITSFGRNISAEWPESLLLGSGIFAQALVAGDARPFLVALVVPASAQRGHAQIQRAIDDANLALPDYARIRRWIVTDPFSQANGLATANGRLRRAPILEHHGHLIESLYATEGSMT